MCRKNFADRTWLCRIQSTDERANEELIMPFPQRELPEYLVLELNDFLNRNDFIELYESYSWNKDNYDTGFSDILGLETQLARNDMDKGISLQDVRDVAAWGKLRNPGQIAGNDIVLPPNTLHSEFGYPPDILQLQPIGPVRILEERVRKGIGPTYLSKVLRFGLPQEYGAIDSRCVRVFGNGDPHSLRHNWLDIRARNDGYGWYIPRTQAHWPKSYGVWIDILRFFSNRLPHPCPHPQLFVATGLRCKNMWACADVEMALFAYASRYTGKELDGRIRKHVSHDCHGNYTA